MSHVFFLVVVIEVLELLSINKLSIMSNLSHTRPMRKMPYQNLSALLVVKIDNGELGRNRLGKAGNDFTKRL